MIPMFWAPSSLFYIPAFASYWLCTLLPNAAPSPNAHLFSNTFYSVALTELLSPLRLCPPPLFLGSCYTSDLPDERYNYLLPVQRAAQGSVQVLILFFLSCYRLLSVLYHRHFHQPLHVQEPAVVPHCLDSPNQSLLLRVTITSSHHLLDIASADFLTFDPYPFQIVSPFSASQHALYSPALTPLFTAAWCWERKPFPFLSLRKIILSQACSVLICHEASLPHPRLQRSVSFKRLKSLLSGTFFLILNKKLRDFFPLHSLS